MQSKWIWYRGDYEIYHGLKLHSRRQEYDVNIPPFWCQPTVYPTVSFAKVFEAKAEGYVKIIACGNGFVRFDGDKKYPIGKDIFFSEGSHRIDVTVNNPYGLPCIYAVSDTVAQSKEQKRDGRGGADRTESVRTDIVSDDDGVGKVIYLLKNVADQHRH